MASKAEIVELLKASAKRLELPAAFVDPAFQLCLVEASGNQELVENFDRLTGCKVGRIASASAIEKMVDAATGFRDDQLRQFSEFVHDCVYTRLPDDAIHALRITALTAEQE